MRTGTKALIVIVTTLGVIAVLTILNRAPPASSDLVSEVERAKKPVRAVEVVPETVVRSFARTGVLEANMDVTLMAEVGGRVERIFKELGDDCERDEVLLVLEQDSYKISLAQAKASLRHSEVMLDQARRNLARVTQLQEQGIAPAAEFDEAQSASGAAEASVQAARAGLRAAKRNLEETSVRCPFSGRVAECMVDVGDTVGPSVALARLVNVDQLKVTVSVSAAQLAQLRIGQRVSLADPDLPGSAVEGRVSRLGVAADPETKTFPVEIVTPPGATALRPGQIVEAVCEFAVDEDVLVVPVEAVSTVGGKTTVLVVSDGMATRTPVELGPKFDGRVIVNGGLEPGAEVVTVGGDGLDDGAAVEVIQKNAAAEPATSE
jgi:RND family efflux transporter MFP subunit